MMPTGQTAAVAAILKHGDQHLDSGSNLDPTTMAHTRLPSSVVEPREVEESTQQAATQPGSGSVAHEENAVGPTWKEQVVCYAKKTRGTVLGQPDVKETGEKIVQGELPAKENL